MWKNNAFALRRFYLEGTGNSIEEKLVKGILLVVFILNFFPSKLSLNVGAVAYLREWLIYKFLQ